MDRLGCVDVPAFPLQLLLKQRTDWKAHPVAVVDMDRPSGKILWINDKAKSLGVRTGQRFSAALSLARNLKVGVVSQTDIDRGVDELLEILRRYTPHVEPKEGDPGVFWLDAKGLLQIHVSLDAWAKAIRKGLAAQQIHSSVVVGFTRFGTYAVAKAKRGTTFFAAPEEENAAARAVLLSQLDMDPRARDALLQLGIETIGDLLRLPSGGLLERFGPAVYTLHRSANGELFDPLQPVPAEDALCRELILDEAEKDEERLSFWVKRLLDPLLLQLERRGEVLASLCLKMKLDHAGDRTEDLRPAVPTLDGKQLMGLLQLRLSTAKLPAGVVELSLSVCGIRATAEQLRLFRESRRNLEAGARAFARLRARFGEGSVVRAQLKPAHLPEASFAWEPLETLVQAQPLPVATRSLVRRIYEKPVSFSEPQGRLVGPYVISGGWWQRPVARDYYFLDQGPAPTPRCWIYFDQKRGLWFTQGRVE